MNSRRLERFSRIGREDLDQQHYLQSMMAAAYQAGLMTEVQGQEIQLGLRELLSVQAQRYTAGDSSSVPVETAEELLESLGYAIGYGLQVLEPENALKRLLGTPLAALHDEGRRRIVGRWEEAKALYRRVKASAIDTANRPYHDTIEIGIPAYLAKYEPYYFSYKAPEMLIDYPLYGPEVPRFGVDFAFQYQQRLLFENLFLRQFAPQKVEEVLQGVVQDYEDQLMNLLEPVYLVALGCLVAQEPLGELTVSEAGRRRIRRKLEELDNDALRQMIADKTTQLLSLLGMEKFGGFVPLLVEPAVYRIAHSLKEGHLEAVFVTAKKKTRQEEAGQHGGQNMSDEALTRLVDEIKDCSLLDDKLAVVENNGFSPSDLAALLENGCFFDDEYAKLFGILTGEQLDGLRREVEDCGFAEGETLHLSSSQVTWMDAFVKFQKNC